MLHLVLSLNCLLRVSLEALDKIIKSIFLFLNSNSEYSVSKGNERGFVHTGETAGRFGIKRQLHYKVLCEVCHLSGAGTDNFVKLFVEFLLGQ